MCLKLTSRSSSRLTFGDNALMRVCRSRFPFDVAGVGGAVSGFFGLSASDISPRCVKTANLSKKQNKTIKSVIIFLTSIIPLYITHSSKGIKE